MIRVESLVASVQSRKGNGRMGVADGMVWEHGDDSVGW
jgi:hypothetical protein